MKTIRSWVLAGSLVVIGIIIGLAMRPREAVTNDFIVVSVYGQFWCGPDALPAGKSVTMRIMSINQRPLDQPLLLRGQVGVRSSVTMTGRTPKPANQAQRTALDLLLAATR